MTESHEVLEVVNSYLSIPVTSFAVRKIEQVGDFLFVDCHKNSKDVEINFLRSLLLMRAQIVRLPVAQRLGQQAGLNKPQRPKSQRKLSASAPALNLKTYQTMMKCLWSCCWALDGEDEIGSHDISQFLRNCFDCWLCVVYWAKKTPGPGGNLEYKLGGFVICKEVKRYNWVL